MYSIFPVQGGGWGYVPGRLDSPLIQEYGKALATDGIFASIDLFHLMKVNNQISRILSLKGNLLLYKGLCQDNNLRKCEVSASAKGLLLYFDRGHWIWIVLRDLSYHFHEPRWLRRYRNIALFSKFAECFLCRGEVNSMELMNYCSDVTLVRKQ